MTTGDGNRRRKERLGQRAIVDQALSGVPATKIAKEVGLSDDGVGSFLRKDTNIGTSQDNIKFTKYDRYEGAMRHLFGRESPKDIARTGHAGKSVDQRTVERWVAAFKKLPVAERERRQQVFEQSRQGASGADAVAGPSAVPDPFVSTPVGFGMDLPYTPVRAPDPAPGSDEDT